MKICYYSTKKACHLIHSYNCRCLSFHFLTTPSPYNHLATVYTNVTQIYHRNIRLLAGSITNMAVTWITTYRCFVLSWLLLGNYSELFNSGLQVLDTANGRWKVSSHRAQNHGTVAFWVDLNIWPSGIKCVEYFMMLDWKAWSWDVIICVYWGGRGVKSDRRKQVPRSHCLDVQFVLTCNKIDSFENSIENLVPCPDVAGVLRVFFLTCTYESWKYHIACIERLLFNFTILIFKHAHELFFWNIVCSSSYQELGDAVCTHSCAVECLRLIRTTCAWEPDSALTFFWRLLTKQFLWRLFLNLLYLKICCNIFKFLARISSYYVCA